MWLFYAIPSTVLCAYYYNKNSKKRMKENNGKYLLLDEMNSFQLLTFHIIRQEDIYKENNFPLMMSKMSYLKTYYHVCLFYEDGSDFHCIEPFTIEMIQSIINKKPENVYKISSYTQYEHLSNNFKNISKEIFEKWKHLN